MCFWHYKDRKLTATKQAPDITAGRCLRKKMKRAADIRSYGDARRLGKGTKLFRIFTIADITDTPLSGMGAAGVTDVVELTPRAILIPVLGEPFFV